MKKYRESLINNFTKENFINDDDGFQRFCHMSLDPLNKHAPGKKTHTRGNEMPSLMKNYQKQDVTKASQSSDISINVLKENTNNFSVIALTIP